MYRMTESDKNEVGDWYRCQCGIIFQSKLPDHNCYDEDYVKKSNMEKEANLRIPHPAYITAPLIEETTYGRMMLDVGFNTRHTMDYFKERGWLTWGIDCNKDLVGEGNIYKGDFETYDFSPNISDDKLKELGIKEVKRTFDLIWMSHVLEHFNDPIKALQKAYNLLSPTGMMYISVADIDFLTKTGVGAYPHWSKHEHNILWSERALVRELKRIGFDIIMKRRNISKRFSKIYDCQVLVQVPYL